MWTLNEINELFDKYNVGPSKRFGQNFLVDQNILSKIVAASNVENKDVIEIGPGLGSLTRALLNEAKSVTSYEIDEDMVRVLSKEIKDDKFKLVFKDFLEASFDWEGKRSIVANIPYNITSPILFKIFENIEKFDQATLMVQKEVADRLTAKPKTKEYGKLTVTANCFADIFNLLKVPPTCFIPQPKVESAVVLLRFNDNNFTDKKLFLNFVKRCFAMKRKTIFNNLRSFIDKDIVNYIFENTKINPKSRPEELTLEDYEELLEIWKKSK